MKKDRIALLRERYISAKKEYKEPYFDADEIDDLLNSFEELGDFSLYGEVLALGLRLHPGNTALQIRRCRQYLLNDEVDKALTLIQQIGEKGNQDLDILEIECYATGENYAKVVELTEALIDRKEDYLDLMFEYITPILNDVELFHAAADYAERGLRLFPKSLILKEELCIALENTEDFDRAIVVCNELIDLKPYSFDEWFALGRLYAYKGDYEHAIEAFDFALTCDDRVVELKLLLAYCLSKNGNYERALEICREDLTDEMFKERVIMLMAECYIKMNDHAAAYKLLRDRIDEAPLEVSSSVYMQLMGCCIEMERLEEAYELLIQAHLLKPDDPEILFMLSFMPEDGKDKEQFFAEICDMLEKIIEEDDLLALDDPDVLLSKKFEQLTDPRILTQALAKEYIRNKDNSN
ncbi:tetratricopeptide repeat protein [Parabacteroides sp. PF5-6]|uniref:tetratricopeptide repeat protein n=1 Tax=Parabacteroides sp. PF5-6 TaxID=1742403 RepID=UPI0024051438|nr:tetratricopeptide repeat protein [Parabacteroides sp. PF5-6]MDF9831085.1 tetratricopeptide (TPR) repeat protein [Parabacteroides sp. PF5-6]